MFSAFTNTFHKSDKPLSEKGLAGVLYYTEKSGRDIAQFAENNRVSANSLMAFGALLGDDFHDVTSKLGSMLIQWSNIMMEFADSIDQYHDMLKIIPIKEASLQPSRDQKRKIREKIDVLQGSLSSMDKLVSLEDQLQQLEKVTELDEIEMDNFKRINTSKALHTLFEGMQSMASKTNLISNSSKYIVNELHVIPLKLGHERPPYQSEEKTKKIVNQVKTSLETWDHYTKQLPPVPIKSSSTPITPTQSKSDTVIPPRIVSLEEQHKQFSFYKPDEIPDSTSTHHHEAGFSHLYLNSTLNDTYIPNKEYEELASSYNSKAVFRTSDTSHDAGGFVLPSFNPNYIYPSTSSHSTE